MARVVLALYLVVGAAATDLITLFDHADLIDRLGRYHGLQASELALCATSCRALNAALQGRAGDLKESMERLRRLLDWRTGPEERHFLVRDLAQDLARTARDPFLLDMIRRSVPDHAAAAALVDFLFESLSDSKDPAQRRQVSQSVLLLITVFGLDHVAEVAVGIAAHAFSHVPEFYDLLSVCKAQHTRPVLDHLPTEISQVLGAVDQGERIEWVCKQLRYLPGWLGEVDDSLRRLPQRFQEAAQHHPDLNTPDLILVVMRKGGRPPTRPDAIRALYTRFLRVLLSVTDSVQRRAVLEILSVARQCHPSQNLKNVAALFDAIHYLDIPEPAALQITDFFPVPYALSPAVNLRNVSSNLLTQLTDAPADLTTWFRCGIRFDAGQYVRKAQGQFDWAALPLLDINPIPLVEAFVDCGLLMRFPDLFRTPAFVRMLPGRRDDLLQLARIWLLSDEDQYVDAFVALCGVPQAESLLEFKKTDRCGLLEVAVQFERNVKAVDCLLTFRKCYALYRGTKRMQLLRKATATMAKRLTRFFETLGSPVVRGDVVEPSSPHGVSHIITRDEICY